MTRLIKTSEEIDLIREGGKKLGKILAELASVVKPGYTSAELEALALKLIAKAGGKPAFKDYRPSPQSEPFPSALCISIDDEIVHGPALPDRTFKEGQLVGIDIGMEYPVIKGKKGYFTDTAVTVAVGTISVEAQRLLNATQEGLYAGIEAVKPGNTLDHIGTAVEAVAKKNKLGVIRDLVGHGVGLEVHEDPQVPNYHIKGNEFPNVTLKEGMVIAIEPMFTLGGWQIAVAPDDFTFITADHSLSAHFEHTVLVTKTGYEIIT
ncbi:MAG: type I methionyl aminopeptidase [Candidatus Falkowbacteria bacterium]|nr:type I methionyl aminopeptidase [Candidatus Falkowbacteria bacterium]